MAKKKAKYHVKSGSSYDQLLFETILSQISDSPIKSLERNTDYNVNAICSETTLAKGGFLVCTQAGTTASTIPTAYETAEENATIVDGTAKFIVHYFANLGALMGKTAGSTTQPIYFNNGVPTATSYSLAKSVPSDAKFTDTIYTHPASGVTEGSYRKVTVDALGHVTGGENPILAISEGGTGASDATTARTNLGIDATYFNPTGTIIAFAGSTLPDGYLLCDGSQVSRTTYKRLFNVIGTTYGEGDGSTTFTLPNLIDRFLEGSSAAGSYYDAGLPNITGQFSRAVNNNYKPTSDSGTFESIALGGGSNGNSVVGSYPSGVDFSASRSNPIYGSSDTVQPPALTAKFLIKY